jgi:hypothetical protein
MKAGKKRNEKMNFSRRRLMTRRPLPSLSSFPRQTFGWLQIMCTKSYFLFFLRPANVSQAMEIANLSVVQLKIGLADGCEFVDVNLRDETCNKKKVLRVVGAVICCVSILLRQCAMRFRP